MITKFVAVLLMTAGTSMAVLTPMDGIQIVCTGNSNFLAFNLNAKRIWIGKRIYVKAAKAEELTNVELTPEQARRANVNYKGLTNIDFGNGQLLRMDLNGTLLMDKIPMESILTISVGGQTKSQTLLCKSE